MLWLVASRLGVATQQCSCTALSAWQPLLAASPTLPACVQAFRTVFGGSLLDVLASPAVDPFVRIVGAAATDRNAQ